MKPLHQYLLFLLALSLSIWFCWTQHGALMRAVRNAANRYAEAHGYQDRQK